MVSRFVYRQNTWCNSDLWSHNIHKPIRQHWRLCQLERVEEFQPSSAIKRCYPGPACFSQVQLLQQCKLTQQAMNMWLRQNSAERWHTGVGMGMGAGSNKQPVYWVRLFRFPCSYPTAITHVDESHCRVSVSGLRLQRIPSRASYTNPEWVTIPDTSTSLTLMCRHSIPWVLIQSTMSMAQHL